MLCGLVHEPMVVDEQFYDGPAVQEGGAADIIWTNRGGLVANGGNGGDGDRFGATFGANAENARLVVDAVIRHFERMIGSFNYSNGTTNFSLSLSMASSGTNLGASAGLSSTLNGKPKGGSVTMGRGLDLTGDGLGDGGNWYIDLTPNDHSEFLGTITNAFSGNAQAGSPAAGLNDFYTVVAAEVTHTLGLLGGDARLPAWNALDTNTGIADNAEGGGTGTFYVFRGPSIKHLMTSNNGGPGGQSFGGAVHSAGPGGSGAGLTFEGDTYIGSQSIGNAVYENSRRYIPDLVFSLMFKDAYAYDSVDPSQFGTFYAMLNETTDNVLVRGSAGPDTIVISRSGSQITFSVDPLIDVGGTSALPGGGNLPAWVTTYDASEVSSITVQAAGSDDNITIIGDIGMPITIDGNTGTDTLIAQGGDGNDTITVAANSVTIGSSTYTLTAFDRFNIRGMGGNDLLDATALTLPSTMLGGTGSDTLLGGLSADNMNGEADVDSLVGNNGIDQITVGSGDTGRGGDNNDTFTVITDGSSAATISGDAGSDVVNVNATARVVFDSSEDLNSITLAAGATATVALDGTLVFRTLNLNIDPAATFDLNDNAAIVDYTGASPVAAIEALVDSGYNNATWNGSGINSAAAAATPNRAIGYAEAIDLFTTFPATFLAQSIDDTAVLLRYTIAGDGNLDRSVNISDFSTLAANFNSTPRRWSFGDFNFDQVVNISDFSILAANFNQMLARQAPGASTNKPLFATSRISDDLDDVESESAWGRVA